MSDMLCNTKRLRNRGRNTNVVLQGKQDRRQHVKMRGEGGCGGRDTSSGEAQRGRWTSNLWCGRGAAGREGGGGGGFRITPVNNICSSAYLSDDASNLLKNDSQKIKKLINSLTGNADSYCFELTVAWKCTFFKPSRNEMQTTQTRLLRRAGSLVHWCENNHCFLLCIRYARLPGDGARKEPWLP